MDRHRYFKLTWLISLLLLFGLFLVACSPASIPDTGSEITLDDLPPSIVSEVTTRLSQELNVAVEEIQVTEIEQVEWPDGCLGIPQEGQVCTQVVTPGFRIMLEVNEQQYEFRSNQDGTLLLQLPGS